MTAALKWKPEPNEAGVLEKMAAFLRRYVILSEQQAALLAVWVIHTYAFDAADTTAYVNIKSAEKRSGKTLLLEVLSLLVAHPWITGRVTAAVLVRKTSEEQPTLLLDESDAAFKGNPEYTEALRSILNAGFRRGGAVSLCVGQGANLTYRDFPVFCPKALAGIGRLPDTVADRSIPIELKRRSRSERVERFRFRKAEVEAQPLREDAASWAETHLKDLKGQEPDLPEALDDRAQDIIEPLLAIADAVGGEWPEKARAAAVALLTGEDREDSESLGVRLLRDLRKIFDKEETKSLATATILKKLHAKEEAPWGSLRGEPLDARGLARLLKPYGIRPDKLREGNLTFRGYKRSDFEDAWSRYTPNEGDTSEEGGTSEAGDSREDAEHQEHVEHPANQAESGVPRNGDVPDNGADTEDENPLGKGSVPRVPDNLGRREAATAKRRLTVEEVQEFRSLMREGRSPKQARAEVLARSQRSVHAVPEKEVLRT